MLDHDQRQAFKNLLLPRLGSNPSTLTVAPYVGDTLASSLPVTNEVGSVAEWIIDRLLEQAEPAGFVLAVERLEDGSAGTVGRLVELAVSLKGDPGRWKPTRPVTPSKLPAFWNVPNRNDYFTGREDLLTRLEDLLKKEDRAALTQAITGLGGVGKTQIAVELCYRNKEMYPFGVFWADASSAASLTASYASFALDLGWATRETPVDEAAAAWMAKSSRVAGWLLVLDTSPKRSDPFYPDPPRVTRSSPAGTALPFPIAARWRWTPGAPRKPRPSWKSAPAERPKRAPTGTCGKPSAAYRSPSSKRPPTWFSIRPSPSRTTWTVSAA